jgi:methylase of polypeptide subunit release factors
MWVSDLACRSGRARNLVVRVYVCFGWVQAAYLANAAVLGDQMFFVDKRVIVPRSYIAETLRGDLSPFVAAPDQVTNVLDMCTGSGCLVRGDV